MSSETLPLLYHLALEYNDITGAADSSLTKRRLPDIGEVYKMKNPVYDSDSDIDCDLKEVENDRKTGDVRLWNPKERKPIKAEEGKHQTLVSSILSNDKKGKEEVIYVTGTVAT